MALALHETFRKLAHRVSHTIGTPVAFVIAALTIVVWAAMGPLFGFSDTWQLVINTSTTIITFLVVFLIQNTQNHDAKAIHLKLDELIRALQHARTGMVDLESLPDEDLDRLEGEFHRLRLGTAKAVTREAREAKREARGAKQTARAAMQEAENAERESREAEREIEAHEADHSAHEGEAHEAPARHRERTERRKSPIHRRRPAH